MVFFYIHYFGIFVIINKQMLDRVLLNNLKINVLLNRLTCQLLEFHEDFSNSVLIGLQPRGIYLLERIVDLLKNEYGIKDVKVGKLDTTFYRDDFRRSEKIHFAKATELNFEVEGRKIVLIDDVLYTGRSIRAALTAIDYYGRPSIIELLVLIDRRFSRHLPIQPDYLGVQIDAIEGDKVRVEWRKSDRENDCVYIEKES
ncbi:MAG: pyrimidine operon attenuation protein/uracil phosphoribosyltransferase [Candidatus Marivariicella framensis]